MDASELMRLTRESLALILVVSAPPLLVSLAVGLVVAIVQAATQLQEQTLSFVPKLAAVAAVLAVLGSAMGAEVLRFSERLFVAIPSLVR